MEVEAGLGASGLVLEVGGFMELALLAMVLALAGVFVGFAVDLGMALVLSVFLGTAGLAWEVWGFAEVALLVVVMGVFLGGSG
jgi:hypothetical protein